MALRPTFEEQELLAETKQRAEEPLASRELACELITAAGFLCAVALLWALQPPGWFELLPAALCFGVLVLATNVKFETPFGFTTATQLAYVPLVFVLPAPVAPLAVAAALALPRIPEVLSGNVPPARLVRSLSNSWFAIGPAAVLVIAHTTAIKAGPALLVAALAAQILVDVAVSAGRIAIERGASLVQQLRESWVYGIDIALSVVGLLAAEDIHRVTLAALAPLPLLALLAVFARERAERIDSLFQLSTAYRGTALVLGDVIEADDGYTGEHCKSVVRLALDVARTLGLDPDERRNLEFAALLHDVGKIAIPKDIINKPGRLTASEWRVIETHTLEGQKLLDKIGGFMQTVGAIVRSHHERWDGTGYPDQLRGEEIPLAARIITACDAWNAMRTDRVYRPALEYGAARAEMLTNIGGQFDPAIAKVLLELVEQTEGSAARTALPSSSTSAEAVRPYPTRPATV